nr:unnamed protein product [Callosobruchus analis]
MQDEVFQPKNLEQWSLAEVAMKFHRMVKNWVVWICFTAVFLLIISPLLDSQRESSLPFPAAIPFDYSYSPLYEVVYIYQGVSIICQATVNLYCEIIFTALTTFVGVQCEFICHELGHIEVLQAEDVERLVVHHRRTALFSKTFDAVFSMIYFIQFASITLAMCMSMFVLTEVENQNYMSLFLVIFQCTLFSIILFPCWFASEMQRKVSTL